MRTDDYGENMRKALLALKVCVFVLLLYGFVLADTVILKSGKQLDCLILEKTKEYIKVEYNGNQLYYETKTIKEIIPGAGQTQQADVIQDAENTSVVPDSGSRCANAGACFTAGVDAAAGGDFAHARAFFAAGLKIEPDNDDITGAVSLLDSVEIGRVTRDFAGFIFAGTKAMLRQHYDKAVDSFQRAFTLRPDDLDVRYNLALACQANGDYASAITYLKQIVERDIEDAHAYCLLGIACRQSGNEYQAREYLVIAKKLFEKQNDNRKALEISKLLDSSL